tara:strand:+ start:61 stop:510 length:450 start_codon:yes stop_codon:yes gene_type:complete
MIEAICIILFVILGSVLIGLFFDNSEELCGEGCGYSGTMEEVREHEKICDYKYPHILEIEEERKMIKKALEERDIQHSFYDKQTKRKPIPQNVKDKVWNRDGGKCVECGSNENLEFDHIIPFSKGGANTYRNLQLLCEHCNRSKSDRIG